MEGESARWSLLGHGLYLAPEPMVLTTVLHSLIPNRNNTEEPDLVLGEREAKPWVPALLGRCELPNHECNGGKRVGRKLVLQPSPNQVRFRFIKQSY